MARRMGCKVIRSEAARAGAAEARHGTTIGKRSWRRLRLLALVLLSTGIWYCCGFLDLFFSEWPGSSGGGWTGAWLVIDQRLWFTTGTVDYYQGIALSLHWSQLLWWWIYREIVHRARRLAPAVRPRMVAVFPIVLGQALIVLTYLAGWL